MNSIRDWWLIVQQSLSDALVNVAQYVPMLAAALLVMGIGWLVAFILRIVVVRLGLALDGVFARLSRSAQGRRLQLSPRLIAIAGNSVFWIAILLFAAIAARVAGLDAFSAWLDRVVDYVPTLVAGALIALAGYLLSALVRDLVTTALASAGSAHTEMPGLVAQTAVFVTAIVIGLDQIGIDVTFLIILFAVVLGGAFLSIAFAFGFGARDFVGNLIASHQAQRVLEPGGLARIGDIEGRVLEITPTAVVLVNEHGRMLVPAKLLQQQIAALLSEPRDE